MESFTSLQPPSFLPSLLASALISLYAYLSVCLSVPRDQYCPKSKPVEEKETLRIERTSKKEDESSCFDLGVPLIRSLFFFHSAW
jgi:hypothetical protein